MEVIHINGEWWSWKVYEKKLFQSKQSDFFKETRGTIFNFKLAQKFQRYYCRFCGRTIFGRPYQTENLIHICPDCMDKLKQGKCFRLKEEPKTL